MSKVLRFSIFFCLILTFFPFGASVLAETPVGPDQKDRCAVCGMFVAPFPNWVAVIQFNDGTNAYFDGPKDMFTYFSSLPKYNPNAKKEDIGGLYVTEYYTTQRVNAEEVYFVISSDVLGPMGHELIPVQGLEKAKIFMRDHGGKKLMQFDGKKLFEIPLNQ